MSKETRDSIANWADETFGPALDIARITRALEETGEGFASTDDIFAVRVEIADVIICLCTAPITEGVDVPALVGDRAWEFVEYKMAINRKRQWTRRGDGNGDHVKAESSQ